MQASGGGAGQAFQPASSGRSCRRRRRGPHYLCCNADESEPGTFKDREILRWSPHQLIEGCLIAAYAIRADHIYVYCRGEFFETNLILARAVEEAYGAGLAGTDILGSGTTIEITVHQGAGAYICGEETALMTSLEGDRGAAENEAALPGSLRGVREAHDDQQCGDPRRRAPHPPQRGGGGTGSGEPKRAPARNSSA